MVREMKKEDWNSIADIYKQGIEHGKSTFNTVCPEFEEWDAAHIQECRFVDEEDGRVVGFTVLSPVSGSCVYHGVVEVSIYIDDAYQGRGIGAALLQRQCEESEKAGYWSLYSSIFSMNGISIAIHKKCGFREVGYREKIAKDKFGNWQDTTIMERRSKVIL